MKYMSCDLKSNMNLFIRAKAKELSNITSYCQGS